MSKLVKKRIIEKVLAGAVFISMFLPIFGIKHHHECEYDECLKVFVDYKFGECVESTIEDMVLIIAVVWYVAIYGGGMILNKDRNAVSPFVFAALLIAQSIFCAIIDPAQWRFVVALLLSFATFTAAYSIANKMDKIDKNKELKESLND